MSKEINKKKQKEVQNCNCLWKKGWSVATCSCDVTNSLSRQNKRPLLLPCQCLSPGTRWLNPTACRISCRDSPRAPSSTMARATATLRGEKMMLSWSPAACSRWYSLTENSDVVSSGMSAARHTWLNTRKERRRRRRRRGNKESGIDIAAQATDSCMEERKN